MVSWLSNRADQTDAETLMSPTAHLPSNRGKLLWLTNKVQAVLNFSSVPTDGITILEADSSNN